MAAVLQEVDEAELINVALVRNSGGACLRGILKTSGRAVALKLLSTGEQDSCLLQMQDMLALDGVCMERVLQPVGVYRSRFLTGLLWDWMKEGSLHTLLYETVLSPALPLSLHLRILLEVAEGLNVLHTVSLPHAALKTTNVLLDQQYHAKLCDWGRETLEDVGNRVCNMSSRCFRNLAYRAPEVVQGTVPCGKSDVYSFGVLMWETLNKRPPGEGFNQLQNLAVCAQKGAEPSTLSVLLPPETPQSQALAHLMTRCWAVEPKQRPLAEECVLELKKILESLDSGADCRAVHLIKTRKERALLSCKHTMWELPVDLNNLEGYDGCTGTKELNSKTVPVSMRPSHTRDYPPRGSPHCATATRVSPPAPAPCCRDVRSSAVRHCAGLWDVKQSCGSAPVITACDSLTSPTHTLLHPANRLTCPMSSGQTCCRLLQERREVIVRFMTEGRLNNLLDVLRSRRAVTREHYEFITAAMTLSSRTRCLLDTCACLGENVAALVATTLGLVCMEMVQGHAHARISPEGQVG